MLNTLIVYLPEIGQGFLIAGGWIITGAFWLRR